MKDASVPVLSNRRTTRAKPRVRDAQATTQRILKASRAEFAKHGYMGARVDRIAQSADANKRMLYAHFGGKDELWLVVLEHAYAAKRAEERGLDLEGLTPEEAMRRLEIGRAHV